MKNYAEKKARNTCSSSSILKRFPFINWARSYNLDCFIGDLIAGLTTALTVIPQGIGYAPLAGLPLEVSPYSFWKFKILEFFLLKFITCSDNYFDVKTKIFSKLNKFNFVKLNMKFSKKGAIHFQARVIQEV